MHMVRHQVSFDNLTFLLPGQRMENRSQMTARLPEYYFAPSLGQRTRHGTCSPIWNGIGIGKALTFKNPPFKFKGSHQTTWGGFYRNGQTSSSLTGRTSGLPKTELASELRLTHRPESCLRRSVEGWRKTLTLRPPGPSSHYG